MILLFLLIISIVITFLFKIQSYTIAYLLLLFIGICNSVGWFNKDTYMTNNDECLIGKEKKVNGIFFNTTQDCSYVLLILKILVFVQRNISNGIKNKYHEHCRYVKSFQKH